MAGKQCSSSGHSRRGPTSLRTGRCLWRDRTHRSEGSCTTGSIFRQSHQVFISIYDIYKKKLFYFIYRLVPLWEEQYFPAAITSTWLHNYYPAKNINQNTRIRNTFKHKNSMLGSKKWINYAIKNLLRGFWIKTSIIKPPPWWQSSIHFRLL